MSGKRKKEATDVADVLPEHLHLAEAGITAAEYARFRKIVGLDSETKGGGYVSFRELVEKELTAEWKSLEMIARATRLTTKQVNSVFYGPAMRYKWAKRYRGGSIEFALAGTPGADDNLTPARPTPEIFARRGAGATAVNPPPPATPAPEPSGQPSQTLEAIDRAIAHYDRIIQALKNVKAMVETRP